MCYDGAFAIGRSYPLRYAIHKQPDLRNKWIYVVVDYEGTDETGKRRFPVVGEFKTKHQAEKWVSENE